MMMVVLGDTRISLPYYFSREIPLWGTHYENNHTLNCVYGTWYEPCYGEIY
jgi:hypothetical protein